MKALLFSDNFMETLLEKSYLPTVLNPDKEEKDHKEANMYLAEDRILCLGIFCLASKAYTLKYVPDAVARTDAISSFPELISQR
jgi:chitin synthase